MTTLIAVPLADPEELQADQPIPQMNTDHPPDAISIDLMQLSISERSVIAPLDPVAAPVHPIIVPRVHVHSAGAHNLLFFQIFHTNLTT